MDLILIRHPAVAIDAGVCYGQTDVPLAGDAREAARLLDARLHSLGVPPCEGAWFTSPLTRCAQLAAALGESRVDARLMELDFGAWEGRAWDGIERALLDEWAANLEHGRPHGGESLAQFTARVMQWFDETTVNGAETVNAVTHAVTHSVTHAGVIRVLCAQLLKLPAAAVLQWPLDYGAIVQLRRAHGAWLLVRWNA